MSTISDSAAETFDYVIVGAGAGGSILANRLTEDGATTVCLLEAGPTDWHPFLHIPAGFIKAIFNPAFTWQFSSEPTDNTNGRRVPIPQGRTLGGSTSINGLAYTRGQPADYDGWAAAGNNGWCYEDVLPYFKLSERKVGIGEGEFPGRAGEQIVTDMDWIHPVCEAFIAGAAGAGIPRNPDYNGAFQEGAGYYQRTIHRGWRQSAARSFIRPIKGRRNLELKTNAQATAIVLDGKQAVGIRYVRGNQRPSERVLIVTDTMRDPSVAEALMGAALAAGAEPVLTIMPTRRSTPQEPPQAVSAAMAQSDIAYLYTTYSLTHSAARVEAQKAGARTITMPGVTEDGFLRTLSVDMDRIVRLTNGLSARVSRARTARVTTVLGTDMQYELEHPLAIMDGVVSKSGDLDAFPPGLFLSVPTMKKASGIAVVDGSITQIGRVSTPVTMRFEESRLVTIDGGNEAARLSALLASLDDPNAYEFAAWGIGTNPGAALIGEDPSFERERVYGWTHVSTGSSAALPGGTVKSKIHLDGIIGAPTIYLDGELIVEKGKFVVEF